MRTLWMVAALLVGCGPAIYEPSLIGRACEGAGVGREQHCASPSSYVACDTSGSLGIWREYPCQDACTEGGTCALDASKAGTACSPTWVGVMVCKAPRLAVACVAGQWEARTCDECPSGATCFACSCG